MEEMELKQIDLVDAIGGKSRVSEILNRKRRLTVQMIRNLTLRLNLSPSVLIKDYSLNEKYAMKRIQVILKLISE